MTVSVLNCGGCKLEIKMAPKGSSDSKSSAEVLCDSCSRSTRSEIKCVKCGSAFHASCAVRITGVKVVGYNELCCSRCSALAETETESDNGVQIVAHQQLVKTNETLNSVILQLMASQEFLKSELKEVRTKLNELTSEPAILTSRQSETASSRQIHGGEVAGLPMPKRTRTNSRSTHSRPNRSIFDTEANASCLTTAGVLSTGSCQDGESQRRHRSSDGCRNLALESKINNGGPTAVLTLDDTEKPGPIANYIEPKNVFAALHEEATRTKLQEVINLGNLEVTDPGEDWKKAGKRRRPGRRNAAVIGDRENNNLGLKAVARRTYLHVYRLAPDTTENDVIEYLKGEFPEVTCVKLNSKHPTLYSSFKVSVNSNHAGKIMEPSFWPKDVCVNRFFHYRQPPKAAE